MSVFVRTKVFDSRIFAMYQSPTGSIHRWTSGITRQIEAVAIINCPTRTGHMATQHFHTVGSNQFGVFSYVGNHAAYSKFVHEGTAGNGTGFIVGRRRFMIVRPSPHSFYSKPTKRTEVRGQRAQPWIADAMDSVLAAHRV
jgi:hypothetical protein